MCCGDRVCGARAGFGLSGCWSVGVVVWAVGARSAPAVDISFEIPADSKPRHALRRDDLPTEFAEAFERAGPGTDVVYGCRLLHCWIDELRCRTSCSRAPMQRNHGYRPHADRRGRRGHTSFSPPVVASMSRSCSHRRARVIRGGAPSHWSRLWRASHWRKPWSVSPASTLTSKGSNDLLVGGRSRRSSLSGASTRVASARFVVLGDGLTRAPPHTRRSQRSRDVPGIAARSASIAPRSQRKRLPRWQSGTAICSACRFDAILGASRAGAGSRRASWESPAGMRSGVTDGIDATGVLVRSGLTVERVVSGEVRWRSTQPL